MFKKLKEYTKAKVWKVFHPGEGEKPKGGVWDTGYVVEGDYFLAFFNIGTSGRTEHDYHNEYDEANGIITWFGKTDTDSYQPLMRRLLDDEYIAFFCKKGQQQYKILIFRCWKSY